MIKKQILFGCILIIAICQAIAAEEMETLTNLLASSKAIKSYHLSMQGIGNFLPERHRTTV